MHVCASCGQFYLEAPGLLVVLEPVHVRCPHCGCGTGFKLEAHEDDERALRCQCCAALVRVVIYDDLPYLEVKSACEGGCGHGVSLLLRNLLEKVAGMGGPFADAQTAEPAQPVPKAPKAMASVRPRGEHSH